MARNRHGAQKVKAFGHDCSKCLDRGYTWMCAKQGLMTMCDCSHGKELEVQFDEARTNLQIHRKLSRDGVLTRV